MQEYQPVDSVQFIGRYPFTFDIISSAAELFINLGLVLISGAAQQVRTNEPTYLAEPESSLAVTVLYTSPSVKMSSDWSSSHEP